MKGSTIKSLSKIKFLFVARGPGEAAQARALARYIAAKGGKILFAILKQENRFFLEKDKNFKIFFTPEPLMLKTLAGKEKPDVILFFNSKTWGKSLSENPFFLKYPLSLSVDSNWLFNEKKYPAYPFLKNLGQYFVLFPKKIFEMGLKENGGNFEIEKTMREKIVPVGFIPSYEKPSAQTRLRIRKKFGLKKDEKWIFCYFSGFGAGHRVWALDNFLRAVDSLIKKGKKIRAIYTGPTEDLDLETIKRPWLLLQEKLSSDDYFLTLASADLVFQHQGMVTLAQAISANVPVICNVGLLRNESSLLKLHFWEVESFAKVGACKMFSKSSPSVKISQAIEELLYHNSTVEKMRKKQRSIFENGEKRTFEIIKKLLNY